MGGYLIKITEDSTARELMPLAMAIHELVGRLPVAIRSLNRRGLVLEEGKIAREDYTGTLLERVLREGKLVSTIVPSGPYEGIPGIVVPIKDEEGRVVAAVGVVDYTGLLDMVSVFAKSRPLLLKRMVKAREETAE